MLEAEATLPRATLDADYTARATVTEAEFARIMGLYQSLSDAAHGLPDTRAGLEFCRETGLQLDLFGTKPGELRPLVVFIHGGYWRALSRAQSAFAAPILAAKGEFGLISGTRQWTMNGKPLYYFAGDAKPGDRMGDGQGGVWHVISSKPAAKAAATSAYTY